jgi:hypothetical protein
MPREIMPDGDLRFEAFASYPNSAGFPAEAGLLEYAENVELNDGVVIPRKGSAKVYAPALPVTYACSAHSAAGDSILLWGENVRFNCQTGLATPVSLAQKTKARGQGYQDAATMESTDPDFVACAGIINRLVTAKNAQLSFTQYGSGTFDPIDGVNLIQHTYDPIQAIVPNGNTMTVLGKRSIYMVEAGMGYFANVGRELNKNTMHGVQKVSAQDGVQSKEGWAESGGLLTFLDRDGIKAIQGGKFTEGSAPISTVIQDIIDAIDPTKIDTVCAVGLNGRHYYSLPLLGGFNKRAILVLNTANKGLFESIHLYPVDMDFLCVARKDGVPRLWGVNKGTGGVFLLDEGSLDVTTPVQAKIRSRMYMFKTHFDKKYDDIYVYLATENAAEVETKFITTNPDGVTRMDIFSGNIGTSVRRALANKKSMGGRLEIIVKSGKVRIMSIGVEASLAGRSIFSSF